MKDLFFQMAKLYAIAGSVVAICMFVHLTYVPMKAMYRIKPGDSVTFFDEWVLTSDSKHNYLLDYFIVVSAIGFSFYTFVKWPHVVHKWFKGVPDWFEFFWDENQI